MVDYNFKIFGYGDFESDSVCRIDIDDNDDSSRDDNENDNNDNIQGGPLQVVNGVITPINGQA